MDKLAEASFELLNFVKTNVISDYDILVHTGKEYATDAADFREQMVEFGGYVDQIQKSMEQINSCVNDIMEGFDQQKSEVAVNSEYMSQINGEFDEIVHAVQNNREIVSELEKIIAQFKI